MAPDRPLHLIAEILLVAGIVSTAAPYPNLAEAAEPRPQCASGCQCSPSNGATWHVTQTENFRILCYGSNPVDAAVAERCESLRREQFTHWFGAPATKSWTPKCDIVLHPSAASYARDVGGPAGSTIASSLVTRHRDVVQARRIDVRATAADWQQSALPHELTHVVLADRFDETQLPRWIDEGLAILADPAAKQHRHDDDLQSALLGHAVFRVSELLALSDYPAANRWGTFYGQSASLVKFLVERDRPEKFTQFVQLSHELGYDAALRQVYKIDGVADFERRWQAATVGSRL